MFFQIAEPLHRASGVTAPLSTCRIWVREVPSDAWELLPSVGEEGSDLALETVAKDHPFTEFMVEAAHPSGGWRRAAKAAAGDEGSSTAAEADTPAWRESLKEGSWLDATDTSSEDKWYAAKVQSVEADGTLTVRYETWSSKYNESFPRDSDHFAPLHTHTQAWRGQLRPLDKVELLSSSNGDESRWYIVTVSKIDRTATPPTMTLMAEDDIVKKAVPTAVVVPVDSLDVAPGYYRTPKPKAPVTTSRNNYFSSMMIIPSKPRPFSRSARHRAGRPLEPGAVGFDNLGNTCFMNSMLQCLNACEPLTRHFLTGPWESEVNVDNVLGQGGRIAAAYASLVEAAWSGKYAVCAPSDVKSEVGRAVPQFQGFQQHDSQELMSFLMDFIHEDLNRIVKKPYVEDVSSDGRPEAVVALEAWRRYKLRNDSVVVDNFTGQFRSHLTCNVCGLQSVTFDPFTSVSVPISEFEGKKTLVMTMYPADTTLHPVRFKAFVPKHGVMGDLAEWLQEDAHYPLAEDTGAAAAEEDAAAAAAVPPSEAAAGSGGGSSATRIVEHSTLQRSELLVCKVDFTNHCVAQFCGGQESIGDIAGGDWMYVYQVPKPSVGDWEAAEKAWEARSERAIAANALARADKPIPRLEGETDADIEALLNFKYTQNRAYVMEMRQRRVMKSTRYYGSTGPTLQGFSVPELVVLPELTGSLKETVMPTGEALYAEAWRRMSKFVKADAVEKYSAQSPPFEIQLAGIPDPRFPSRLGEPVLVPNTSEPVELDRYTQVLLVDWTKESEADWREKDTGDTARNEPTSYGERVDKDDETSITSCFERFVSKEQLGSNDMWFCPRCKEHVQAYKQMSLYSVPDVLIVHLKRFHVTNYGRQMTSFLSRSKLDNLVEYPLTGLDMSEFVSGPQQGPHMYDCFAVSDHMGGMGGGHYAASARNFESGKWYHFNDSSVRPAKPDSITSRSNYVLFFKRRTPSYMSSARDLEAAAAESVGPEVAAKVGTMP